MPVLSCYHQSANTLAMLGPITLSGLSPNTPYRPATVEQLWPITPRAGRACPPDRHAVWIGGLTITTLCTVHDVVHAGIRDDRVGSPPISRTLLVFGERTKKLEVRNAALVTA